MSELHPMAKRLIDEHHAEEAAEHEALLQGFRDMLDDDDDEEEEEESAPLPSFDGGARVNPQGRSFEDETDPARVRAAYQAMTRP